MGVPIVARRSGRINARGMGLALQKNIETRLLEVVVGRESFLETMVLHDEEGNAVREGPVFVQSAAVESKPPQIIIVRYGNNRNVFVLLQIIK